MNFLDLLNSYDIRNIIKTDLNVSIRVTFSANKKGL